MRPIVQDLLVAGAVQGVALLGAGSILDHGGVLRATELVSAAYWCGVLLVVVRRHRAPTDVDRQYVRWGLLALLLVGVPVTIRVWEWRGGL